MQKYFATPIIKVGFCLFVAGLLLITAACGDTPAAATPTATPTTAVAPTSAPTTAAATPTTAPTTGGNSIAIANFAFSPTSLTVAVGTKVTWTNNDSTAHTVTADQGAFNSNTLDPGKSYSFTFTTAGTFSYHCAIHPSMTATIVVQ